MEYHRGRVLISFLFTLQDIQNTPIFLQLESSGAPTSRQALSLFQSLSFLILVNGILHYSFGDPANTVYLGGAMPYLLVKW